MRKSLLNRIKNADQQFSKMYLRFFGERNALIVFFFHGLCEDDPKTHSSYLDPWNVTPLQRFRQFVEYYLEHAYTFVTPNEILTGLNPHQNYIMATFDDGYANNQLTLPVLREYKIPAVFYIATGYVQEQRSFWWDIVYRERLRSGIIEEKIHQEQESLKSKTWNALDRYIIDEFGEQAFKPHSDLDRPFRPAELRAFAQEKYVCLGNHTRNHAILTNCTEIEIRAQVEQAQKDLRHMTGITPTSIAYPNGNHNATTLKIVYEHGLAMGLTVQAKKNYFPIETKNKRALKLARFHISNEKDLPTQCELIRSDVWLYPKWREFFR